MKIRENLPISSLTTMRLGGPAHYVIDITTPEDIPAALEFAEAKHLPVWFMGSGANTIGHDAGFPGVILLNQLKGIAILQESDEQLILRGAGGEIWDDIVDFACKKGYSGIEALSKIPGTLGAAPVQNIGAYGQDVSSTLREIEAYDTREQRFVALSRSELNMGYRHTRLNFGPDKDRFFITSVTLCLRKTTLKPPFYNSLQRYIDAHGETDYSPANIRRIVSEIRASKLPDPTEIASAGSFFKNVFVGQVDADTAEENGIPVWRTNDDGGKISAGWLIEHSGLAGRELHGFHLSPDAALVLINDSATSYQALDQARSEIIDTVRTKFGFTLEQEPVEIPSDASKEAK